MGKHLGGKTYNWGHNFKNEKDIPFYGESLSVSSKRILPVKHDPTKRKQANKP